MENHHDHHEEPKPSNKWITTPIIMALLVIGCIVTFLGMASGTCCGGKCNEKTKTEQHGTTHEEDHGDKHEEEGKVEDKETVSDSTKTEHSEGEEHTEEHSEGHGH